MILIAYKCELTFVVIFIITVKILFFIDILQFTLRCQVQELTLLVLDKVLLVIAIYHELICAFCLFYLDF